MLFSQFLIEEVGLSYGHFVLDGLDKLAGKSLFISFYPGADVSCAGPGTVGRIPRVPIFFFPFGEMHDDLFGFHLLPQRVKWEHLTVAKTGGGGVEEIAPSLPEYVRRELSYVEALHHEDGDNPAERMEDSVAQVNQAFGPDFYRPGRRGPFDTSSVDATVYKPQDGMMSIQVGQTYEYVGRGEVERAARSFVRSMDCYHYTLGLGASPGREALETYFALGRGLLAQVPDAFPERIRCELSLEDDAGRIAWILDLWAEGAYKASLKAVCDLCYVRDSWQNPLIHDLLMAHFGQLKMSWAAALLEWRGAPEDRGRYDDLVAELRQARAAVA